ncbi:MAG: spondin domain-containing protein [Crocosphaera sp.]|nr:spondin domain-containing protein [Crocosphaera sp.]
MYNQFQRTCKQIGLTIATLGVSSGIVFPSLANAAKVQVTITNVAPQDGLFFSQTWVGFHDGTFDIFDLGQPAPAFVEPLAEDATVTAIAAAFAASNPQGTQETIEGPNRVMLPPATTFDPPFFDLFANNGSTSTEILTVDPAQSQYFSYGAMALPSNDAFIANGDPFAFKIFDDNGNFIGADFIVTGNQLWDAGVEVNDEIPQNTAAIGQISPNTGVDENGVVTLHPGMIPGGNILAARPNAPSSDFFLDPNNRANYTIARIQITQVPEPSITLGLIALGGMLLKGRRFSETKK